MTMFTYKLYSQDGRLVATLRSHNPYMPMPTWWARLADENKVDTYQIVGTDGTSTWKEIA